MYLPCRLMVNGKTIILVFDSEEEAEAASKIFPDYVRFTSVDGFMNALILKEE